MRFSSEEGRINNIDRLIELWELRDVVLAARSKKLHRNLHTCVETEHCEQDRNADDEEISVHKDMDRNREATAVITQINSNDKEIQSSVLNSVSTTKTPLLPISKFTNKIGAFVVLKVNLDKLEPF